MTRDSDFKNLVRARMAETGQTYTAARADLTGEPTDPEPQTHPVAAPNPTAAEPTAAEPTAAGPTAYERARREQERTVGRFIVDGRMVNFPMRRKARAAVLLHLLASFEPGRSYPEREVNDILGRVHEDHAFWRRELVDYGYLERTAGVYRVVPELPQRPDSMRQEIPDWERLWLPGFLSGRAAGWARPAHRRGTPCGLAAVDRGAVTRPAG